MGYLYGRLMVRLLRTFGMTEEQAVRAYIPVSLALMVTVVVVAVGISRLLS